jgi:hypothetical protein
VIGGGSGPSFFTSITIPASNPGGHYIVAIQDGGGTDTASYAVLAEQPEQSPTTGPGSGSTPDQDTTRSGGGAAKRSPASAENAGPAKAGLAPRSDGIVALPSAASHESIRAGDPSRAGEASSAQSAVADLWAAFARPRDRALSGLGGPGTSTGGDSSILPVGMAMLTVGLLALLGGFGVAAAHRRRARAD